MNIWSNAQKIPRYFVFLLAWSCTHHYNTFKIEQIYIENLLFNTTLHVRHVNINYGILSAVQGLK